MIEPQLPVRPPVRELLAAMVGEVSDQDPAKSILCTAYRLATVLSPVSGDADDRIARNS
ncbi:hypothetical protein [Nocardia brasiliensis]|uniref:hypothetical protein n=1 Tax=Nocardia brasiliensis TaxID=37326 RepID=UPI00245398BC|nr:hypothetical protein [Nocardia brasiliensis]